MFCLTFWVDMPCLADFPHLTEYPHNPFLSIPSGTAVGFLAAVAHPSSSCTIFFCTHRCCLQISRALGLDVYQRMPQNPRGTGWKGPQGCSGPAFLAKAQSRQNLVRSGPCAFHCESSKDEDPTGGFSEPCSRVWLTLIILSLISSLSLH